MNEGVHPVDGALPRPRASTWGADSDRAVLQAIAEDLTRRSGFAVCAIEVLRADEMLEFAAIAGSPSGSDRLLGQGSPLASMDAVLASGWSHAGWRFVAGDQLSDETREVLAEYGHRPDLVPDDTLEEPWLAEDMLLTPLTGVRGQLRALLYLDEPHNGRRPTPADLEALQREVGVVLDSVVGIVERETFGEQMRMVEATREVIRAARHELRVEDLLDLVSSELPAGFRATHVGLTLADLPPPGWERKVDVLAASMRRIWRAGGELIIDPDDVWGDDELPPEEADELRRMLADHGVASSVMVPLGLGGEFLGVLSMARAPGLARWSDSEVQGAHLVAADIAGAIVDARSLERAVRLNAELRAVDDYRRQLLSTIAHELQNPAGVLIGHLELLEDTPQTDAALRSLAAMGRASDRIVAMGQNLVDLSKVADPDRPVPDVAVDLARIVGDVVDLSSVLADGAGIDLALSAAPGVVVRGDEEELRRLVTNLVSNAIKYTPDGGAVAVRLDRVGDQVELEIADSGLGIAEEDRPELFTPFFRSGNPEARSRPGTGLGLAIVQRVVERHRGTISVASALGVGTTFLVTLPPG